jgi:hypothetical protein
MIDAGEDGEAFGLRSSFQPIDCGFDGVLAGKRN